MRLRALISTVTLLAVSAVPAFAQEQEGPRKITLLDFKADTLEFVVDGAALPGVNTLCDGGRRQVLYINTTVDASSHPNHAAMAAAILTAFNAGQDVTVFYNTGVGTCGPELTRLRVHK